MNQVTEAEDVAVGPRLKPLFRLVVMFSCLVPLSPHSMSHFHKVTVIKGGNMYISCRIHSMGNKDTSQPPFVKVHS